MPSFEEFSSARRRKASHNESAAALVGAGSGTGSGSVPAADAAASDPVLDALRAQFYVLVLVALDIFLGGYVVASSILRPQLEVLARDAAAAPLAKLALPVVALLDVGVRGGCALLWLASAIEAAFFYANAFERRRGGGGVRAVLSALTARPLRVADSGVLVLLAAVSLVRGVPPVARVLVCLRLLRFVDVVEVLWGELTGRGARADARLLAEQQRVELLRGQVVGLQGSWDREAKARAVLEAAQRDAAEEVEVLREALVVAAEEKARGAGGWGGRRGGVGGQEGGREEGLDGAGTMGGGGRPGGGARPTRFVVPPAEVAGRGAAVGAGAGAGGDGSDDGGYATPPDE